MDKRQQKINSCTGKGAETKQMKKQTIATIAAIMRGTSSESIRYNLEAMVAIAKASKICVDMVDTSRV